MSACWNVSRRISIHALREEGDVVAVHHVHGSPISIHALREEGDINANMASGFAGVFLSTPSARRATVQLAEKRDPDLISIHALREEGDRRSASRSRVP